LSKRLESALGDRDAVAEILAFGRLITMFPLPMRDINPPAQESKGGVPIVEEIRCPLRFWGLAPKICGSSRRGLSRIAL